MFKKCFIWKVWIKILQVLFKVNKKSTFCFEDILSMVTPIEMKPKRLVRGLLEISKKVQELSKMWKIEQDTLFRSWGILDKCTKGHFGKNAKFSKWAYNLLIQTCS